MFEHPKGKVATFSVNNFHSNRTLKISDIFSPSGSKSTKHIENTPSSFSELKKILHNGFDSVRKVTPHRIIIE